MREHATEVFKNNGVIQIKICHRNSKEMKQKCVESLIKGILQGTERMTRLEVKTEKFQS